MEQHIKIVELFGLPGCGKTTLEYDILKGNDYGYQFCEMSSVSKDYRKENLFYRLLVFPYSVCILWVIFFLLLPKLPKNDWRIYKSTFLLSIIYKYAQTQQSNKYMLVDHGIIQSVSSLMYKKLTTLTKIQAKTLNLILKKINIDFLIFCKIRPEEAMQRMRSRNRTDSGRLDKIKSNMELVNDLNIMNLIFSNLGVQCLKHDQYICINTERSIADCKETLLSYFASRS